MIICMCRLLCVTNRKLVKEDFIQRIEAIAACRPDGIILREKDMDSEEYKSLAIEVIGICGKYNTTCILHGHVETALELGWDNIHIPLQDLIKLSSEIRSKFKLLGSSCHSISQAKECEKLGCNYAIAGHIFDTDCKKGLPGRGVEFYKEVCDRVNIPIFAIGGISPANYRLLANCNGAGICIMSGGMECENVKEYLGEFV